jgi:hypothetical protein
VAPFRQAEEWVPTLRQTDWAPKVEQLAMLYPFGSMKTGAGIKTALAFAASLSGISSQSSSSDESASKKLKTTGTTYLTTTDFNNSIKVDVDKTLFEGETKEEKEKKNRVKEEKKEAKRVEAKRLEANKEAREGMQNAIEEANLLGRESKEERKRVKVEAKEAKKREKVEAKRVKVEAPLGSHWWRRKGRRRGRRMRRRQ